jgi:hypothetical protein
VIARFVGFIKERDRSRAFYCIVHSLILLNSLEGKVAVPVNSVKKKAAQSPSQAAQVTAKHTALSPC